MALRGTEASYDPLSALGGDGDGFTTVFDSAQPAASQPQPPAPAAAAEGAVTGGGSEYDSFMTARSAMSYMSSASPMGGGGGGGGGYDESNPFAASPAAAPPPPRQRATNGVAGPLSFGDERGAALQDSTAFDMPADLYDAPDAFAASHTHPATRPAPQLQPQPAAPYPSYQTQAQQGQLQPLYGFTREFSTALPLSNDPISPPALTPAATLAAFASGDAGAAAAGPSSAGVNAAWSDNPFMPAGAGGGDGGGAGPSGSVPGGGGAGGRGASSGGGYAAASLLTNTVTVTSPRKAVGPSVIPGLTEPYVLYRVTSRGAGQPEASVERRFRDVVALGEALQALYPGCFVPPRPSRSAIEGRRMQAGFIEERRHGIEKFLRRLVVHPVLGPSEVTQAWLRTPTADLRSCPEWLRLLPAGPPGLARSTARLLAQVVGRERTVPSPLEATRPASERGDVYRLLHERAAAVRGVTSRMQPSPMEERLKIEGAALQERCEALVLLSRRADALVTRGSKLAKVLSALTEAMGGLAEADVTAAASGTLVASAAPSLRVAAEGCDKVGKLQGVATDACAKHLDPLNDWLAAAPGAAAALAARERCLLTAATLARDELEARVRLTEAEGKAGTSPAAAKRAEALRQQAGALGAACAAARDEYERVGSRNEAELAAFKLHMSRELADCVREFALVQAAAAAKAAAAWQEAGEQLAALAAGGGVGGAAAAGGSVSSPSAGAHFGSAGGFDD
ncbi:hypothetical protein GPECTOR_18g30 [Gonium pectorale]|uniref:PX domain-containing protein n=1 Tax=Gonium pectorale TaxID=33097 RepID=A0A150GL29_GONPE|nr:hypothetical protein GPECTOR_18g30 [Gonium pectorale]|eukprot:KXZ50050.1 hypothetical protein GPECTOR_18g30 [Gonium pectorale]